MIERQSQLLPIPASILAIQQQGPENVVARLSPMELLGLDKPRELITIGNSEETIEVTKAVAILMNSGGDFDVISEGFLNHFGLKSELYDEDDKESSGLFADIPDAQTGNRLITDATLGLLGVTSTDRITAFRYSAEARRFLSSKYVTVAKQADRDRELFPFRNLKAFPKVSSALEKIAKYTDIQPENIFKESRVPIASPWQNTNRKVHPLLLEVALSMIVLALEEEDGEKRNAAQIGQEHFMSRHAAQNLLLTDRNTSPLSDDMFTLIKGRIRKGK